MRNGKVVVNAVKIEWVVQILSVSVLDAFLESKVAGVCCGRAFSTRRQPTLSLLGPLVAQELSRVESAGQRRQTRHRVGRRKATNGTVCSAAPLHNRGDWLCAALRCNHAGLRSELLAREWRLRRQAPS